jgi:peptidoglycan hydrolase CwlO-like protein
MLWNMGLVMKKIGIIVTFLLVILFSSSFGRNIVYSDTPSPSPSDSPSPSPSSNPSSATSSTPDCANHNPPISVADCPAFMLDKVNSLSGQANTMQKKIDVMKSQISLTEARIEATQEQITSLILDIDTATKKISGLQASLNSLVGVLANRIVATYEVGTIQPFQILLTSDNASDFFKRLNYLKIAQVHDKQLVYDTQQAKVDYANQKVIFEEEKKKVVALQAQLQTYTDQLNQQKQAQQDLLAQVQEDKAAAEAEYSRALAELAGFSRFVTNQGGASILSGQTSCDGWGCYYNQRDSQWGNMLINNQSGYSMAGYGCLITSIAMVASHMGHTDILPSDISQSGDSNFAVGTAMLKYSISVKGVNISRSGTSPLDSGLQSGPVIVGIYAYGGTHFVVLKSGSAGNYVMNDPFIAGGHVISFTDHYSLNSIFEIDRISI